MGTKLYSASRFTKIKKIMYKTRNNFLISVKTNSIQFNSIQVYLYSAFYDTNHYKATLQKIKFLQYLVVAYQWWLSVHVHMAEMFRKINKRRKQTDD